jgi:tetratricopeptide (TPR) repeat protein
MRRLLWWQLPVLLTAAATANAQVQNPAPSGPPESKPEVTVTAPRDAQDLPQLRSDVFVNCMSMVGAGNIDYVQATLCEHELAAQKRVVVEACMNRDGNTALPRVIQACTESLDHDIFEGNARFFLYADRAAAYFAAGDKQHALDDYNEALKLASNNSYVYYNRGIFYAAQSDGDAALRDFNTSIGINAKFVPALRQRARIYLSRGNFTDAREDYSKAINLEPRTAALWSERGYISLRLRDYESAVKDEAEAIRLDPKLARAYYLRGAAAAFGGLGDSALNDIKTAVDLDPSLATYIKTQGKTASLGLPPF